MKLKLGVNCGFATNRYIEPEVWGEIVGKKLRLRSVQFVADLLNPFFPEDYIDSQIKRILESSVRNEFSIDSIFLSSQTRTNHLMSPDEQARKIWLDWFKKLLLIGARLGVKTGGGHFGILTVDTANDPDKKKRTVDAGIKAWQDLTYFVKDLGYESLIFEPMSIPREFACTISETRELMERINTDCGVPMLLCLDVGHAPHPDERDPYMWLLELGEFSPVVHIQQSVLDKSMHWPFTPEYNQQGIIRAEKVIQCLEKSGCLESILIFELYHKEHWDSDWKVIEDYQASVDYWRQYVKD